LADGGKKEKTERKKEVDTSETVTKHIREWQNWRKLRVIQFVLCWPAGGFCCEEIVK